MIINFNINCKAYEEKILNNYKFHNYVCPKCGNKHSWNRHGTYERNIVSFMDDVFVEDKIKILRLKCTSCISTHAILPSDIIPYSVYSISTILKVLIEHYDDNHSVLFSAQKNNISFQLIYSILTAYIHFFNEAVSTFRVLNIIKGTFIPTLKELLNLITNNSNYFKLYFEINKWPFLMKKFRNKHPIPIYIGASYFKNTTPT